MTARAEAQIYLSYLVLYTGTVQRSTSVLKYSTSSTISLSSLRKPSAENYLVLVPNILQRRAFKYRNHYRVVGIFGGSKACTFEHKILRDSGRRIQYSHSRALLDDRCNILSHGSSVSSLSPNRRCSFTHQLKNQLQYQSIHHHEDFPNCYPIRSCCCLHGIRSSTTSSRLVNNSLVNPWTDR